MNWQQWCNCWHKQGKLFRFWERFMINFWCNNIVINQWLFELVIPVVRGLLESTETFVELEEIVYFISKGVYTFRKFHPNVIIQLCLWKHMHKIDWLGIKPINVNNYKEKSNTKHIDNGRICLPIMFTPFFHATKFYYGSKSMIDLDIVVLMNSGEKLFLSQCSSVNLQLRKTIQQMKKSLAVFFMVEIETCDWSAKSHQSFFVIIWWKKIVMSKSCTNSSNWKILNGEEGL